MSEFLITLRCNDSPSYRLHPLAKDVFLDAGGSVFSSFSNYYLWLLTKQENLKHFSIETIKGLYPELAVVLANKLSMNLYDDLHNTFYMRLNSYGVDAKKCLFKVDDTSPLWFSEFVELFNASK